MSREAQVRFCERRGVRSPPPTLLAVLVDGSRQDTEALREQIAGVLATLGLRLSESKTRVVHISEGFSFLGFRIQRRRKRGTNKHYVYTFIDDRPIRSVKAKIRALTRRTSQLDLEYVLTRLNQVMHGWANYFRHAVAKDVFAMLDNFAWWRVIRMLREHIKAPVLMPSHSLDASAVVHSRSPAPDP